MNKLKKLLVAMLTFLLVLTGCSTGGGASTGKVLRISKDTDIRTLDTSLATDGLSFEVIEQFTDGLLDYDASENLIPRVATSLPEVSADGLTYTFTLRKDAKWFTSTGEVYGDVTAHDFVFAWRRLADPKTASDYNYMVSTAAIENAEAVMDGTLTPDKLGVEATDDYTLVVHLSNAVPYFLQLMSFPTFNPLNEKFVTEQGDQYALAPDKLLSNGPFTLTSWTKASSWELTKTKDYYDADSVKIEGLKYTLSSDYQSAALQFDNKEVDITKISSSLVDQYKSNPAFNEVPLGYLWYISFNVAGHADFKSTNLRLAFAYAIDRDNITQNIMKDGSVSADYLIPKGLASHDGKDFRDGVPAVLGYDVAKAKAYLEAAKQELGVSSFHYEFLIEDSQEAKSNAAQIKSDLEEVGITVDIVSIPKPERLARMNDSQKDYEIGLTRWGPDYADPFTYIGDNFGPTRDQVKAWGNQTYIDLVGKTAPGGELATDLDARWDALHDAEKVFLEDAFVAPIWQSGESILIATNVKGVELHVVGMPAYRNVTISD